MLNVDICFAQNMEYLFCAQYISDIKQTQGDTYLAIHLSHGRTLDGQKITAGMLQKPTALQQLVRGEQAYKFLKNIRGSPAYWQHELYDVLTMLHSLGIPTWFFTLSAADLHLPERIQAVALQLGRRLSRDNILTMSIAQRSTYLQQNPNTGVCMFQHRLKSFFSQYLLSDAHPLGHITDYMIKIEFQMRGSPHAHCLLWVKDAPKINQDSDDGVCRFIDKYITAVVPKGVLERQSDTNLMKNLQKHAHSDYCHRNKSYHFGFPKPPASRTVTSQQSSEEDKADDIIKYAKDVLQKVQNFLSSIQIANEDLVLADLLQKNWDRPGHIHASFTNFAKRPQNNTTMKSM